MSEDVGNLVVRVCFGGKAIWCGEAQEAPRPPPPLLWETDHHPLAMCGMCTGLLNLTVLEMVHNTQCYKRDIATGF